MTRTATPILFTCIRCNKKTNKVFTKGWKNTCFDCQGKIDEEILKKHGITGIKNDNPFNPDENYDYVFGIE